MSDRTPIQTLLSLEKETGVDVVDLVMEAEVADAAVAIVMEVIANDATTAERLTIRLERVGLLVVEKNAPLQTILMRRIFLG